MAEIAAVAKAVRQHWLSQGLRVSSVKPDEVADFCRLVPEGIPEAYRIFLGIAGLPDDEDSSGFRFWLPEEVRATSDVLREAGHASDAFEPSVIIADYLQESWWYALWLAGPLAGSVSLVLGQASSDDLPPPLGTLVDFLLAYLSDEVRLYPQASMPERAHRTF